jgi:hypothetical protein
MCAAPKRIAADSLPTLRGMEGDREQIKALIDAMAHASEQSLLRLAGLLIKAAAVSACFTNDDSAVSPQVVASSLVGAMPSGERWMTEDMFLGELYFLRDDEAFLGDLLALADRYDNIGRAADDDPL